MKKTANFLYVLLTLVFALTLFEAPSFAVNELCTGTAANCCVAPDAVTRGGGCTGGQVWIGDAVDGSCQTPTSCGSGRFLCANNTCFTGTSICTDPILGLEDWADCCPQGSVPVRGVSGWSCVDSSSLSGGGSPWTVNGSDVYYSVGNVGVGSDTTPDAMLDVNVPISHTGGILEAGYNVSAAGDFAVSIGSGTSASGDYAVATGLSSSATGEASFAAGSSAVATNDYAVAFGSSTTASGLASFAAGSGTTADQNYAVAFGLGTNTCAQYGAAFGRYNVGGADDLFEVGYGASAGARANYFTIETDGDVGFGTASPQKPVHATGDIRSDTGFCIGTDCITEWSGSASICADYPDALLQLGGTGSTSNGNPPLAAMTALSSNRVAFVDGAVSASDLEVWEFNGSSWSQIGSDYFISTMGNGQPALATLSSTRIAFIDSTADQLRTYDFNGSTWSQVGSGLSISSSNPTITALSSTQIALFDPNIGQLRTYTFNGSSWSQTGSGLTISGAGTARITTLTSTRIAFFDNSNDDLRAYSWSGSAWSQTGSDLSLSPSGLNLIAGMTSSRVAMYNANSQYLNLYDFNGSTWSEASPGADVVFGNPSPWAIAAFDQSSVAVFQSYLGTATFHSYLFCNGYSGSEPVASLWSANAPDIYYNTGDVGIGLATDPAENLHVDGNVRSDTGFCISTDCITEWPEPATDIWTQNASDIYYDTGGVGIGLATTPQANLHVAGNVRSDTGFCIDTDCITEWPSESEGGGTSTGTKYVYNTAGTFELALPADVTEVKIKAWGAGGGGGGRDSGSSATGGDGGGGGYAEGTVTIVSPPATLDVTVGLGGTQGSGGSSGNGGGLTRVQLTGSNLVVAGAGGGGGATSFTGFSPGGDGGAGGGTTGQGAGGGGATQFSNGSVGSSCGGFGSGSGGGGGAGYYNGGTGGFAEAAVPCGATGGGGGSGYVTGASTQNLQGSGVTPANNGGSDYVAGHGVGGPGATGTVGTQGGSGLIVIEVTGTSGGGGASALWSENGSEIYYNTDNVGVGLTDPAYPLDVSGNVNSSTGFCISGDCITGWVGDWVENGSDIYYNGGNVGIANSNPSYKLDVTGQARLTGGYTTSDERWKKNIQAYTDGLKAIMSLRPVSYEWRNDEFPEMNFHEGTDLGLIAQEVQKVLPELVSEDNQGYLSLDYGKLTSIIIEAVQELKSEKDAQLESGNGVIAEQEAQIMGLMERVEMLEAQLQER